MEKTDWQIIKTEYITGTQSLDTLAKKHGIPARTIKANSKKENWVSAREKHRTKVALNMCQKNEAEKMKKMERVGAAAEDLALLLHDDILKFATAHERRKNLTEKDVEILEKLNNVLKAVVLNMKEIYGIAKVEDVVAIRIAKINAGSGKEEAGEDEESGGIIILPEILEVSEDGEKSIMETTAEAGGIPAAGGV